MLIDFDRITHPLRLAKGPHERGSGKGCAMNVISYINGDVEITDFPSCSAQPLARIMQIVNDKLAGPDGFLSPQDSMAVLELGWLTVGTADVSWDVERQWLAALLTDPDHGVVRWASPDGVAAIRDVAALLRKVPAVTESEWYAAARAARAARAAIAGFHSADFAVNVAVNAASAGANAAAYAVIEAVNAAYAVAIAACANAAIEASANAAYAAANAAGGDAAPLVDWARWAINHWRELAHLNTTAPDTEAINDALTTMETHPKLADCTRESLRRSERVR